jgi:hypothetical protein
MKHLISVLGAGAVLLVATPAWAQQRHVSDGFTPAFAASRAGGFVDLWPTKDNFSTIFGGELQLGVTKELFVDLSYAAAFAHVGDALDSGDNLGFGNPTIGVHVVAKPAERFHFFAGVSATPPLLQDPNKEVSNAAFYGQRIRGFYEADRFVRGHMAARLALGMEWNPAEALFIRGEIRPVVFIPTNDKFPVIADDRLNLPSTGKGATEVMIEQAAEIEGRTKMGLGFGARLQAVSMPMRDDMMQLTAEPFINLTPRRAGLYARVGAPIALDEDLGPGFDRNKLIGARVQIGGQW